MQRQAPAIPGYARRRDTMTQMLHCDRTICRPGARLALTSSCAISRAQTDCPIPGMPATITTGLAAPSIVSCSPDKMAAGFGPWKGGRSGSCSEANACSHGAPASSLLGLSTTSFDAAPLRLPAAPAIWPSTALCTAAWRDAGMHPAAAAARKWPSSTSWSTFGSATSNSGALRPSEEPPLSSPRPAS